MRHDLFSDMLSTITNAEQVGKLECTLNSSKLVRKTLKVIKKSGYIKDFELVRDSKGGLYKIKLSGKINKAKSIKPRFSVKRGDYEKWERRYLPAKGFGLLIVSTPKGIMSQEDAKKKETGGRLLAYIY